jgi:hypothetical protein
MTKLSHMELATMKHQDQTSPASPALFDKVATEHLINNGQSPNSDQESEKIRQIRHRLSRRSSISFRLKTTPDQCSIAPHTDTCSIPSSSLMEDTQALAFSSGSFSLRY